ncbi:hypothetical protein JOD54_004662 [Actinokineospora baliensis]|uniref:hypothetical protein n=1 Tax=Actinokineospora baliensis TaxID=547056 RepID=UPI00195A0E05|nr:hypothetical protein [Actinokineospora baliensis]MBM7774458.1 hypothetical protein [Actinokineospora baliensis]
MTMSIVRGQDSTVDELVATIIDIADGAIAFHDRLGFCWVETKGTIGGDLAWWQAEIVQAFLRRDVATIEPTNQHGYALLTLTAQGGALLEETFDEPLAA